MSNAMDPAPTAPGAQGPPSDVPPAPVRRAWLGGHPLGGVEPRRSTVFARRALDRARLGGLVAAAGGVALVAGSFLPWLTADLTGLGIRQGSGWSNVFGNLSYGPAIAGCGAVVCFLAVLGLMRLGGRAQRIVAALATIVAAGVLVAVVVDLATPGPGVDVTISSGVLVMVVGCALAAVGWALGAAGARPPRSASDRDAATVPVSGAVGADG